MEFTALVRLFFELTQVNETLEHGGAVEFTCATSIKATEEGVSLAWSLTTNYTQYHFLSDDGDHQSPAFRVQYNCSDFGISSRFRIHSLQNTLIGRVSCVLVHASNNFTWSDSIDLPDQLKKKELDENEVMFNGTKYRVARAETESEEFNTLQSRCFDLNAEIVDAELLESVSADLDLARLILQLAPLGEDLAAFLDHPLQCVTIASDEGSACVFAYAAVCKIHPTNEIRSITWVDDLPEYPLVLNQYILSFQVYTGTGELEQSMVSCRMTSRLFHRPHLPLEGDRLVFYQQERTLRVLIGMLTLDTLREYSEVRCSSVNNPNITDAYTFPAAEEFYSSEIKFTVQNAVATSTEGDVVTEFNNTARLACYASNYPQLNLYLYGPPADRLLAQFAPSPDSKQSSIEQLLYSLNPTQTGLYTCKAVLPALFYTVTKTNEIPHGSGVSLAGTRSEFDTTAFSHTTVTLELKGNPRGISYMLRCESEAVAPSASLNDLSEQCVGDCMSGNQYHWTYTIPFSILSPLEGKLVTCRLFVYNVLQNATIIFEVTDRPDLEQTISILTEELAEENSLSKLNSVMESLVLYFYEGRSLANPEIEALAAFFHHFRNVSISCDQDLDRTRLVQSTLTSLAEIAYKMFALNDQRTENELRVRVIESLHLPAHVAATCLDDHAPLTVVSANDVFTFFAMRQQHISKSNVLRRTAVQRPDSDSGLHDIFWVREASLANNNTQTVTVVRTEAWRLTVDLDLLASGQQEDDGDVRITRQLQIPNAALLSVLTLDDVTREPVLGAPALYNLYHYVDLKNHSDEFFTVNRSTACAWLKNSSGEVEGKDGLVWSREGCRMRPGLSGVSQTVCECDHQTVFTVLQLARESKRNPYVFQYDYFMSMLGAIAAYALTALSLVSVLLVGLPTERLRIKTCFLSAFLLYLSFLIGSLSKDAIYQLTSVSDAFHELMCEMDSAISFYALLAMFSLLLAEALVLGQLAESETPSRGVNSVKMLVHLVLGWAIPLLPFILLCTVYSDQLVLDRYTCLMNKTPDTELLLAIPAGLCFAGDVVSTARALFLAIRARPNADSQTYYTIIIRACVNHLLLSVVAVGYLLVLLMTLTNDDFTLSSNQLLHGALLAALGLVALLTTVFLDKEIIYEWRLKRKSKMNPFLSKTDYQDEEFVVIDFSNISTAKLLKMVHNKQRNTNTKLLDDSLTQLVTESRQEARSDSENSLSKSAMSFQATSRLNTITSAAVSGRGGGPVEKKAQVYLNKAYLPDQAPVVQAQLHQPPPQPREDTLDEGPEDDVHQSEGSSHEDTPPVPKEPETATVIGASGDGEVKEVGKEEEKGEDGDDYGSDFDEDFE